MNARSDNLMQAYHDALESYLDNGGEAMLLQAYILGRSAWELHIGVLDVVKMHHDSLALILSKADPGGDGTRIARAATFLAESLAAFEMALRGYQEANVRLTALNESLEIAKAETERAMRARSAFFAMMSHELRTPLNAILGFTELLLGKASGPLNPEQTEQLSTVQVSANHLLSLINDILDLAKVESGRIELKPERVDVNAVTDDIMAALRPLAVRKGLALEKSSGAEQATVTTDVRTLRQILINLVANAIKYTEAGAVRLHVTRRELDGRRMIEIDVSDTGVGIKPEDQQRLFQPFEQLLENKARGEGTGLGLHLSRRLSQLLKGDIALQSEPGKGSTFTLTIPET